MLGLKTRGGETAGGLASDSTQMPKLMPWRSGNNPSTSTGGLQRTAFATPPQLTHASFVGAPAPPSPQSQIKTIPPIRPVDMSLLELWASVDQDSKQESFDPFSGHLLWCLSPLSSAESEFGIALMANIEQRLNAKPYDVQLLRAILTFPANEGSNTKDPQSLLARLDDSLLTTAIAVLAGLKDMDTKTDAVSLMGEFARDYSRAFVLLLTQFCCSWSVEFWDCVLQILNIMPCHGVLALESQLDQPPPLQQTNSMADELTATDHPSVSRRRSSSGSVPELDMDTFLKS